MIVFEREVCSMMEMDAASVKVVGVEGQMSMCRKCERGRDDIRISRYGKCIYSSEGMRKDVRNYYSCEKCSNNKCSDCATTRKTMNGSRLAKTTFGGISWKCTLEIVNTFRWIFLLVLISDKVIGHAYSSDATAIIPSKQPVILSSSSSSATSFTSQSSVSTTFPNLIKIKSDSSVPVQDQMQADFPTEPNQPVSQTSLVTTDLSSSSSSSSEIPLSTSTHAANHLFVHQKEEQQPLCKTCPFIDKAASPNVTALLGKTAYLACRVKNLGDKTVSWVRHRDIHLLTVGRYTYTTDQRFRAILQTATEDYTLMIKYPQHRDSGIYECQVSTTPHLSHYVHLSVVEPVTEVVGGPDLFIDRGSTINLTCTVKFSPEPPLYIIWNHNNNIISYNSPRGGVSVLTEKGDTTTSYLLIQQAKPTDSGKYSCNPSNAASHNINVHVLNGELPAAMQTGGQMPQKIPLSLCLLFSVVLIFGTS